MINMKELLRHIACAFALIAFAACSGNVDPDDVGGAGDVNENTPVNVPEGVLRIFADKTEFSADGNDEVTFTVMFGSEDVSNAPTMQLIRVYDGKKKYMSRGVNKFTTVTAGKYTFKAEYYYAGKYYTDNEVEVEAKAFFNGDVKAYKRRFFGTLFTSTGCNSCPLAAKGLVRLQDDNPGVITIAAFHADMEMAADPMTIGETYDFKTALGGFNGLPAFFWNMREESRTGGSSFAESFAEEKAAYTTFSGVSIKTQMIPDSYDGMPEDHQSPWNIEIGITSNMPVVFRYMILLVEDNIPAVGQYAQYGQGADYIHNNVVRKVLTGVNGEKMNNELPFTVGVEVTASKSVITDPAWNEENMRVVALALTRENGSWLVNNVNECKLGESVSYLYEE